MNGSHDEPISMEKMSVCRRRCGYCHGGGGSLPDFDTEAAVEEVAELLMAASFVEVGFTLSGRGGDDCIEVYPNKRVLGADRTVLTTADLAD